MVLQRGEPLPIWGTASPKDSVTVTFRDDTVTTMADENGYWLAELPPQKVGDPSKLEIKSGEETAVFDDVLVGEVWICSGQSNMEWTVRNSANPDAEIAAANYPSIRLFDIPRTHAASPQENVDAEWVICTPETVESFSAVGYYFGRELWQELQVPIGLVSSAWGGTPAEAWTPLPTLEANPAYGEIVTKYRQMTESLAADPELQDRKQKAYDQFMQTAGELIDSPPKPSAEWFDPGTTFDGAEPVSPDQAFLSETDGLAHVRKVFTLTPEQASAKGARLQLGAIDNYDVTWLNGVALGRTGRDTNEARNQNRDYPIPDGVLKPGKNVVLIQIVDWYRNASFGGRIEAPKIEWASGKELPLATGWEANTVVDLGPRPETIDRAVRNIGSYLWNGMVAPLAPAAFRGVIWYQGESNSSRAEQYRTLFPDMIEAWRQAWGGRDFPFYFVQLANIKGRDGWPELREAQFMALELPNTGMAVTIDIGNPDDIHPKNKQDVGKRLALWALAETYGKTTPSEEPIPHSGPLYSGSVVDGNEIRVAFDYVYNGLKTRDGEALQGFVIAGKDGEFVPAEARIDGNSVFVSHPQIEAPKAVRYAWSVNPEEANLINSAGLPASPFRTDPPKNPSARHEPDESVLYKSIDGHDLQLHIFKPDGLQPGDSRAAVVFFHGGGWKGGSPSQFYPQARHLANKGMVAVSAQYRLTRADGVDVRDCVADGKSAIRWVRQHADELGIDPNRVVAAGGSAGGHIAAATGNIDAFEETDEDLSISSKPNALVLFNPVANNGPGGYGHERIIEYWQEISPFHNIDSNSPPTLILVGTDDHLIPVEEVEEYKRLVIDAGQRCEVVLYEGEKHGFFNHGKPPYDDTVAKMDAFLNSLGYFN